MLSTYGNRYARLLAPSEVFTLYLEGSDSAGNLINQPLLFPQVLIWNPEEVLSGLDLSVAIDAELDLGDVVTDPLEAGLFASSILPTSSVLAGKTLRCALYEHTLMWARAYAGGAASSWEIRHKVTLTNINNSDSTRVHLIVNGLVEEPGDPVRRPLFNLNTLL